jgi:hypothetical protein
MPNLRIHYADDEIDAVRILAQKELRGIGEQIRFLLRQELQRLGYLPLTAEAPQPLLTQDGHPPEEHTGNMAGGE